MTEKNEMRPVSGQMKDELLEQVSGGVSYERIIEHTVQKADTLGHIASKYGSIVAIIMSVNKLSSVTDIYPGMVLKVPIVK